MRAGVVHQALDEHAEKAAQVRVRDEQIERELNGVALDGRHALGPLQLLAKEGELGLEPRDVGLHRGIEPSPSTGRGIVKTSHGLLCHEAIIGPSSSRRYSTVRTMPASSF